MKRDVELLRQILFFVEQQPATNRIQDIEIDGYTTITWAKQGTALMSWSTSPARASRRSRPTSRRRTRKGRSERLKRDLEAYTNRLNTVMAGTNR